MKVKPVDKRKSQKYINCELSMAAIDFDHHFINFNITLWMDGWMDGRTDVLMMIVLKNLIMMMIIVRTISLQMLTIKSYLECTSD